MIGNLQHLQTGGVQYTPDALIDTRIGKDLPYARWLIAHAMVILPITSELLRISGTVTPRYQKWKKEIKSSVLKEKKECFNPPEKGRKKLVKPGFFWVLNEKLLQLNLILKFYEDQCKRSNHQL